MIVVSVVLNRKKFKQKSLQTIGKTCYLLLCLPRTTIFNGGDFTAIPKLLQLGKCILSNVQKWIKFHLAANLLAMIVSFICGLSIKEAPLTAARFLWVGFFPSTLDAAEAGFSKKPNAREIYYFFYKCDNDKNTFPKYIPNHYLCGTQ